MDTPQAADEKLSVPALGRASAVLDHLAQRGQPCGISEMSRALNIAKSTLHGLCDTLLQLGLLQASGGGFEIGPHVLRWSSAYLGRNDISRAFDQVATTQSKLSNYTLTLTILDAEDVVYIGCRNSAQPLGFTFRIGMRLPAVFSATGKAILSSLPEDQRLSHMPKVWPKSFTGHSTPDAASFTQQIRRWQDQGYAVDSGEIRDGMICVGVPIRDRAGKSVAGLAISMTEAEAAEMGTDYFAAAIQDLAEKLAYHLA